MVHSVLLALQSQTCRQQFRSAVGTLWLFSEEAHLPKDNLDLMMVSSAADVRVWWNVYMCTHRCPVAPAELCIECLCRHEFSPWTSSQATGSLFVLCLSAVPQHQLHCHLLQVFNKIHVQSHSFDPPGPPSMPNVGQHQLMTCC